MLSVTQRGPRIVVGVALLALLAPLSTLAAQERSAAPQWHKARGLVKPRTEVSAARMGQEIAVVGGFFGNAATSARVDAYSPRLNRWRRLRDLPMGLNHTMAASYGGRVYVVGGWSGPILPRNVQRVAFVLSGGRWRKLPTPPEARAAGGAAVVGNRLYVVGGVHRSGLATRMMVFDLRRNRWSTAPGPSPREHIAVAANAGRVYAVGGRTESLSTNVATVESYAPGQGWRREADLPEARSGSGAAAIGNLIVVAAGEQQGSSIGSVFAFDVRARTWQPLPDMMTPRHGAGVVAFGGRVYVVAGGRVPGLTVSGVNEFLSL